MVKLKHAFITREFLEEEYVQNNKSPYEIAADRGVNPTTIRRALIKHGIKVRDRSEAQRIALETGRVAHPTEGKERSEEVKMKIGLKLHKNYLDMGPEDKEKFRQQGLNNWNKMSEEEKKILIQKRQKGLDKTKKGGTKLEKALMSALTENGFMVKFHTKHIVKAEQLEMDLFLPDEGIVIEVDGPTHFLPIYGDERLQKETNRDMKKNGLLLDDGYIVIRIRYNCKFASPTVLKDFSDKVVELVADLAAGKVLKREDRLIFLQYGDRHQIP